MSDPKHAHVLAAVRATYPPGDTSLRLRMIIHTSGARRYAATEARRGVLGDLMRLIAASPRRPVEKMTRHGDGRNGEPR